MKRPIESDYTSHVAYTRALEEYCDWLVQPAQEPFGYVYEVYCLPECACEMEWVESFARYEPDAEENIRNVTLVYTTPPAAQPAPPECQTEAEKTAFAFGWWKALESVRQPAVPDAIIEAGESPDYRDGWNDCRQTMLKAREV
jgi:hypothetical protein